MGCKGPETFANCPTVRFNDRSSWPVKAGHGCVGCAMPAFWDQMSPFYRRLSNPPGFAVDVTADQIGMTLVATVTGLTAAHGAASYIRARRVRSRELAATGGLARASGAPLQPPPDVTGPPASTTGADHQHGES
jgi:hydrogenase small subunit